MSERLEYALERLVFELERQNTLSERHHAETIASNNALIEGQRRALDLAEERTKAEREHMDKCERRFNERLANAATHGTTPS